MFKKFLHHSPKIMPTSYDDSMSYYEVVCKLKYKLNEIIGTLNALIEEWKSFDGDHRNLTNRDADNQHPMSAITGLSNELNGITDDIDDLTEDVENNTTAINALYADVDEHVNDDDIHVTAEEKTEWDNKQDEISDLDTIREGAALGERAVQPDELDAYRTASEQDAIDDGKESTANKTQTISSASTATQFPSAKAVYDYIQSLDGNEVAY